MLFIGIFATMVPALQWLNQHARSLPLKTPGQYYFTTGALSSVLDNAPTYLTFLETTLGTLDPDRVDAAWAELRRMQAGKTDQTNSEITDPSVRSAVSTMLKYHGREVLHDRIDREHVAVALLLGDSRLRLAVIAISAGAVLFGACTYIGNGPNFMVKSIAESSGLKMPGFFGYILCYTLPVLLPVYGVVWLLFLRSR